MEEKENILETLKKINIKIVYFKLIYYIINLIINFIQDIVNKCEYMIFLTEHFLSYLVNYSNICKIINKIIDKKLIQKSKDINNLDIKKVLKRYITGKELLSILKYAKNTNQHTFNNRQKLLFKKNKLIMNIKIF